MEKIHQGLSDPGFTKPDGISTRSICSASGKSPSGLCANDYYGNSIASDICDSKFVDNSGTCTLHQAYTVCADTGKLPGDNCRTMTVVLAVSESNGNKVIKNAPSEAPEGKVLINLNETCDGNHKHYVPDEEDDENESGGVIAGNESENNTLDNSNKPAPSAPPTEPPAENHTPSAPAEESKPENNGDGLSTLPGIADE